MTDVKPELFATGCSNELPAWGVTREFDFGQFVILYDERVIAGKRYVTPIVLSEEGDIVVPDSPAPNGKSKTKLKSSAQPVTAATGGVPLHLLYESDRAVELVTSRDPIIVPLEDVAEFLDRGELTMGGVKYRAALPTDAQMRLASGEPLTVIARSEQDGTEAPALIRFVPAVKEKTMTTQEADRLLTTGEITIGGETLRTDLEEHQVRDVLEGRELLIAARGAAGGPTLLRMKPEAGTATPAASRFTVRDLAGFVAAPEIPDTTGRAIRVDLTPGTLRSLRGSGRATVEAAGSSVEIVLAPEREPIVAEPMTGMTQPYGPGLGLSRRPEGFTLGLRDPGTIGLTPDPLAPPEIAPPRWPSAGGIPGWSGRPPHVGDGWMGNGHAPPAIEAPSAFDPFFTPSDPEPPLWRPAQPRNGLQLAILLPWRQQWKLEGFSRGSLLSSIALAPSEETMIRISSWERRAKALEQSAETETDQQVDFTQTTRDTDDVFRELTSRHDFQWQLHGDLDASYSNGVASIRVGVDGGVQNTDSIANVLRTTQNHVREVTTKASTRVRSKRITKITETVESGSAQEVVRRIRNPNQCHTLTLDFHEVLAHHLIETKFLSTHVRVVVLVPNPITFDPFSEFLVRKNESAIRDGLLDPALADGFAACRLLAAYEIAKVELQALAAINKQTKELEKERVKDKEEKVEKPKNPHEGKVVAILGEIAAAAKAVRAGDVKPILNSINLDKTVTSDQRTSGQRWMFFRLAQVKMSPAFMGALFALADQSQFTIDGARQFMNSLPGPGSYPTLSDLNDLPDTDKEDAGLNVEIKSLPGYWFARWAWYTGRCREERLYRLDDGGLAGKIDRLRQAWQDYEAKQTEGEGIVQGSEIKEEAKEEQAQASYADKLEMKYGAEVIAAARERRDTLLGHINDHLDYYRYVLFQALPPGEQLRRLMDVAPQLRVGMFEPHVVAMNGPFLAVPLTPLGETKLAKTLSTLQQVLKTASEEAREAEGSMADNRVILPTPGVSVESWLGKCSGCEEFVTKGRELELRRLDAETRTAEAETARRKARLDAGQLDDPHPAAEGVRVRLDSPGP